MDTGATERGSADAVRSGRERSLLEEIGPGTFRRNAFRVTGIAVDAGPREVSRHHEKLRMMEKLGTGGAPANGAVGLDPPPDADAIREAVQRLLDPERRLVDEFFWFWPREFGRSAEDPALAALSRGDVASAAETWMRQEESGDAVVAAHNLAVLSHMLVLDYEHAPPTAGPTGREDGRRGEQWEHALGRWKRLVAEDRLWVRVVERIGQLDDPRVTAETARRLRAELPLALLSINAQLAVRAAERGAVAEVERQLGLITRWDGRLLRDDVAPAAAAADGAAGEGPLVERALRHALAPLRERVQRACAATRAAVAADARIAETAATRVLEQTHPLVAALDRLLPAAHPVRVAAHDDVADAVLTAGLAMAKVKPRWAAVCGVLEHGLAMAAGPDMRDRVGSSLEFAQDNRDQERCWFCATALPDDPSAVAVPMYGEVSREAVRRGVQLQWRPFTVQVPRCRVCRDAHGEIESAGPVAALVGFLLGLVPSLIFGGPSLERIVFVAVPCGLLAGALAFPLGLRRTRARFSHVKPVTAKTDFPQVGRLVAQGWSLGTKPPSKTAQEK